ncbi:hypothetical protein [Xanthomonas sp. MUS 060]|nr:hypothetical protein [Xanthomonas sp. MUS 060]
MGRVAVSGWRLCLPMDLRQVHRLLLRLSYVFLAQLGGMVFLQARVPVHGLGRHGGCGGG